MIRQQYKVVSEDGQVFPVSDLYWCAGGLQWSGPGVGQGWAWLDPDYKGEYSGLGTRELLPDGKPPVDVLVQCTGLYDKNGRLIWEGDTCRWGWKMDDHGQVETSEGKVFWDVESGAYLFGKEEFSILEISNVEVIS